MAKKLVLFGNGLGRTLDNTIYSLDHALSMVWKDATTLSEVQKRLISQCLPEDSTETRPSSEEDLERLQQVLAACEVLQSVPLEGNVHWLSDHGLEFPSAIHKFIHSVAVMFFNAKDKSGARYSLPKDFTMALCDFVSANAPHIATLNYDSLLDTPFSRAKLVNGASGKLVDGIFGRGFERKNLFRKHQDSQGWFLHLHGSPRYFDSGGKIKKYPNLN